MSFEAMNWVFQQAPTRNVREQIVMLVLADESGDDGAPIPIERLARKTRMTEAQVERTLDELEDRRLITRRYEGDDEPVYLVHPSMP